jgi:hypothetical protein
MAFGRIGAVNHLWVGYVMPPFYLLANMATHRLDTPLGLPSPLALDMATDAVARNYVLPETLAHPMVQISVIKLAYWLMAYGLVSAEGGAPAILPLASAALPSPSPQSAPSPEPPAERTYPATASG